MDNWIKINSASDETRDAIDSVAEVLKDMGIDLVYDDEQATKDNVDLFIRLNHTEEALNICEGCQGNGWVLSNNEEGYKDLQKCDACRVFEWDKDAKASALKYIKYVLDYLTNTGIHMDKNVCPDCDRVLPEEWTRCFHCENKHGREVG